MRVYLPATSRLLRRLADTGVLGPAPMTGFAVTPGLREHYLDDDVEELEQIRALHHLLDRAAHGVGRDAELVARLLEAGQRVLVLEDRLAARGHELERVLLLERVHEGVQLLRQAVLDGQHLELLLGRQPVVRAQVLVAGDLVAE